MKSEHYQKRYTREFKEEAVRLLLTTDKSVKELARELGTSHVSLLNWKEEALHRGGLVKDGKGQAGGVRVHYAVLEQEKRRHMERRRLRTVPPDELCEPSGYADTTTRSVGKSSPGSRTSW
jgi:transposase-like protein